jgi:hypothetical protein
VSAQQGPHGLLQPVRIDAVGIELEVDVGADSAQRLIVRPADPVRLLRRGQFERGVNIDRGPFLGGDGLGLTIRDLVDGLRQARQFRVSVKRVEGERPRAERQ